jgi:hypothetical protein
VDFQVILRLDERVTGIGKMFQSSAGPIAAIGANVEDVFRSEAQPLEQREKGIEAFAGAGTVADADEAESEFGNEGLEQLFHFGKEQYSRRV